MKRKSMLTSSASSEEIQGHFASKCPTKLEKKAQAKRKCYSCRKMRYMAHSCPLGNNSKSISIDDNNVLRKDGNGTFLVAIAKYLTTHTKALPKYVAPNLRGPKIV